MKQKTSIKFLSSRESLGKKYFQYSESTNVQKEKEKAKTNKSTINLWK